MAVPSYTTGLLDVNAVEDTGKWSEMTDRTSGGAASLKDHAFIQGSYCISQSTGVVTERYTRMGNCERCGQCCLTANCEHLEMGEIATCKIHDGERPLDCELFPELPPIMFSTCSYYFIDTWNNNRIIKPREI